MSCVVCHNAYPQLTKFGRTYKEAGYRVPGAEMNLTIGKDLSLEKNVPISAILVARPFDKKKSGPRKLRALHEVELVIAGNIANNWSGFFEIEAEDETGFEPEIPIALVTFNQSKAFNLQMGYNEYFFSDPYGFLADHFRLTRGHVKLIDERFGRADGGGRLRDSRQNVTVYGRVGEDKVFYSIGYSGAPGDAEGVESNNLSGRLAYEFNDNFMLGGFAIDGETDSTGRKFDRTGVDFQYDYEGLRIQGAYAMASDDNSDFENEDNNAFSIQAMYRYIDKNNKTWIPLIRLDNFERNNGFDDYSELTMNVGWYFKENTKVYLEYWKQLNTPNVSKDSRLTLQFVLVF